MCQDCQETGLQFQKFFFLDQLYPALKEKGFEVKHIKNFRYAIFYRGLTPHVVNAKAFTKEDCRFTKKDHDKLDLDVRTLPSNGALFLNYTPLPEENAIVSVSGINARPRI